MADFLDRAWLSCPCPRCGYELEFTILQARLEETVICPCCKSDVKLVDAEASVEGARSLSERAKVSFGQAVLDWLV